MQSAVGFVFLKITNDLISIKINFKYIFAFLDQFNLWLKSLKISAAHSFCLNWI